MTAVTVAILAAAIAIVYAFLADELRAWAPYLANRFIRSAAAQLPVDERERHERDWRAEVEAWRDRPLSALAKAIHIRCKTRGIRESVQGVSLRGDRLKRTLDIALAAYLLLVCSPVFVLIAILIRLDSGGPAFVATGRQGRGGHRFRLYKFRSVHIGLPRAISEDSPSITRVGRILRRFSLDQLPQLLNVLRGEMSLVGPRPLISLPDKEHLTGDLQTRTMVRPGLVAPSGLHEMLIVLPAQHRERYLTMIQEDAEYARSRSFLGDLRILLRTPFVVMRRRPDL